MARLLGSTMNARHKCRVESRQCCPHTSVGRTWCVTACHRPHRHCCSRRLRWLLLQRGAGGEEREGRPASGRRRHSVKATTKLMDGRSATGGRRSLLHGGAARQGRVAIKASRCGPVRGGGIPLQYFPVTDMWGRTRTSVTQLQSEILQRILLGGKGEMVHGRWVLRMFLLPRGRIKYAR